jgi:DNA ligase-1
MTAVTQFRPTLAADAGEEDYLKILNGESFYASPKLDGIRAIVHNGVLVSRSLKPIRNRYIQSSIDWSRWEGLDGELVVGAPNGEGVFARTSSGVMSEGGQPDYKFHVFDSTQAPTSPYELRLRELMKWAKGLELAQDKRYIKHLTSLPQIAFQTWEDLLGIEEDFIELGYEGVIVRWAGAPYKYGRSTLKERYMLKLKRHIDREATIEGLVELRTNLNEPTYDNLGLQRRSSHIRNRVGANRLGAFTVRDEGWVFNVGTGFDMAQREAYWQAGENLVGKTIKYRYLPVGTQEAPRHPVFLGFRDKDDT